VELAIKVGRSLRREGYSMVGIRLDSGNLDTLSKEARRLLDEAGFEEAVIVASNDLDEHKIADLKKAGAPISVWGVGTRLATGFDEPALGGIYKMSAIQDPEGVWRHKLKLSEKGGQTSLPGILQVRRFRDTDGLLLGDVIFDELQTGGDPVLASAHPEATGSKDLLKLVFSAGTTCCQLPSLAETRDHCSEQMRQMRESEKLLAEKVYPVEIEPALEATRQNLILRAQGTSTPPVATRA